MGQRATELYEELLAAGYKGTPQVYRALIQACGEEIGVQKVWDMLQMLPRHDRNNYIYSAAIRACDKARDWRTALRLLDDMQAAGIEPDDVTYGTLLHVLSSAGRANEAADVLQSMKRRNVRHYTSAVRACHLAGDAARALQLFRRMQAEGIEVDCAAVNNIFQVRDVLEHAYVSR
jgi:pentatricopeptide repeat protein